MFTVTLEGEADLEAAWDEACDDLVRVAAAEGLKEGAKAAVAEAEASHPYTDRTGTLSGSNSVEETRVVGRDEVEIAIENSAPYASYVEGRRDGDDHSRGAYRFLEPAIEKVHDPAFKQEFAIQLPKIESKLNRGK